MFEVELKAHVTDRTSVIKRLNSFAKYKGCVKRDDYYWGKSNNKIRIRKQTRQINCDNTMPDTMQDCTILTYKRKELKTDSEGRTIEVNDEKETLIEDSLPFEAFLQDTGYTIVLNKVKVVMIWTCDKATIELCNVKGLGDFIEIEIMSDTDAKDHIEMLKDELYTILDKSGIDKTYIEDRYYSEMLEQLKTKK